MGMSWLSRTIKEIVVYRSLSPSVWDNLAFEDWILKNVDLSFRRILFLWRNSPCVVIGRHQNPWLEANTSLLRARGVELARRRSGGGAVYHDLGNLNCTMFTHPEDYHRPRNLWMVCDALNKKWPSLELSVNEHDDILCREYWKVSGSSAKLIKDASYHHFTLLLHADQNSLHQFLQPHSQLQFRHSSATPSRRSRVANLLQEAPSATLECICSAIANRFYDVHRVTDERKVVEVDPLLEKQFPGITRMKNELKDWEWNYGKAPKFTVTMEQLFGFGIVTLMLEVTHGLISKCDMKLSSVDGDLIEPLLALKEILTGLRFWSSDVSMATKNFGNSRELNEIVNWIAHIL